MNVNGRRIFMWTGIIVVRYQCQESSPKVLLKPITIFIQRKLQLVTTQLEAPYMTVSIQIHRKIIGRATNRPLIKKGTREPSLNTLIARRGTQPTGEVLRIINEIVIKAVRMMVFLLNLSRCSRQQKNATVVKVCSRLFVSVRAMCNVWKRLKNTSSIANLAPFLPITSFETFQVYKSFNNTNGQ